MNPFAKIRKYFRRQIAVTSAHRELIATAHELNARGLNLDLQPVHRFTPGLYIRELSLPADTISISKIHKKEHPFVLSEGTVRVWTPDGKIETISAPFCGITKPGTIRVALAVTDCVWTTFHATEETDLDKIEKELILEIPKNELENLVNKSSLWLGLSPQLH